MVVVAALEVDVDGLPMGSGLEGVDVDSVVDVVVETLLFEIA